MQPRELILSGEQKRCCFRGQMHLHYFERHWEVMVHPFDVGAVMLCFITPIYLTQVGQLTAI